MNACLNPKASLIGSDLDETLTALVPSVDDLLSRVTGSEPLVTDVARREVVLSSVLVFPDEIGRGEVTANLFRYRDDIRLDLRVVHNRMFARPDGQASERACFLNDFVGSVILTAGTAELPEGFVRHVVAGIAAARDGVRRHNRRNDAPWNEVTVAAND